VPSRNEPSDLLPAQVLFRSALSAANAGVGHWDSGWEVLTIKGDTLIVQKDDFELVVHEQDLMPVDGTMAPGIRVRLRFPKEWLGISPGFYTALSNTEMPDQGPLIRIYWNVNAEGGVCLLQSITSILNRACLPFRLKVVNNPSRFIRCDAAILYLRKADYSDAADTLRSVYREIAGNLSPETPAFTKCIAGGVGLAEDPGQGASFGLHRCRLLANGMIDAHFQGRRSLDDKLALVAARFSEDGLRLEEPFLSAGSSGDFYAPINNDRLNNDRRHKAVNGMARGSEVNFAWPL